MTFLEVSCTCADFIEAEDLRAEGARRFWDDYSPPYYKAKKGPNDACLYAIAITSIT
jgi:hypothetical protein